MSVVATKNLGQFLNGSQTDKKAVASETDLICSEIGFLSMVGQGVPDDVIEDSYEKSKRFFRTPMDTKIKVSQPRPDFILGYLGLVKSALITTIGNHTQPDPKETFSMGPETVVDDPYFSAQLIDAP